MPPRKNNYTDFESAIARLEEITGKLESGESKLEESLELYSEGVEIAAYCTKLLSETEKKVTILKERNKQLIEESFDGEPASDGD